MDVMKYFAWGKLYMWNLRGARKHGTFGGNKELLFWARRCLQEDTKDLVREEF